MTQRVKLKKPCALRDTSQGGKLAGVQSGYTLPRTRTLARPPGQRTSI